jgi:hypothetical protein
VFDLFDYQASGKGFEDKPYDVCQQFLAFGGPTDGLPDSTDEKKYFGNGRYSNDIRRAGVTRPDAKASEGEAA